MPRFLIEVSHDASAHACTQAVEVLLRTGSHFLTHANWGCKDGVHKAWLMMDFDSKDDAWNVVPPDFRPNANVIQLNWFVLDEQRRARPSMVAAHRIV
jgi:hypothetical protein